MTQFDYELMSAYYEALRWRVVRYPNCMEGEYSYTTLWGMLDAWGGEQVAAGDLTPLALGELPFSQREQVGLLVAAPGRVWSAALVEGPLPNPDWLLRVAENSFNAPESRIAAAAAFLQRVGVLGCLQAAEVNFREALDELSAVPANLLDLYEARQLFKAPEAQYTPPHENAPLVERVAVMLRNQQSPGAPLAWPAPPGSLASYTEAAKVVVEQYAVGLGGPPTLLNPDKEQRKYLQAELTPAMRAVGESWLSAPHTPLELPELCELWKFVARAAQKIVTTLETEVAAALPWAGEDVIHAQPPPVPMFPTGAYNTIIGEGSAAQQYSLAEKTLVYAPERQKRKGGGVKSAAKLVSVPGSGLAFYLEDLVAQKQKEYAAAKGEERARLEAQFVRLGALLADPEAKRKQIEELRAEHPGVYAKPRLLEDEFRRNLAKDRGAALPAGGTLSAEAAAWLGSDWLLGGFGEANRGTDARVLYEAMVRYTHWFVRRLQLLHGTVAKLTQTYAQRSKDAEFYAPPPPVAKDSALARSLNLPWALDYAVPAGRAALQTTNDPQPPCPARPASGEYQLRTPYHPPEFMAALGRAAAAYVSAVAALGDDLAAPMHWANLLTESPAVELTLRYVGELKILGDGADFFNVLKSIGGEAAQRTEAERAEAYREKYSRAPRPWTALPSPTWFAVAAGLAAASALLLLLLTVWRGVRPWTQVYEVTAQRGAPQMRAYWAPGAPEAPPSAAAQA